MSDDTLVFWNGYKKVFGESGTRKLLCSWHIGQTIGRRVPELVKVITLDIEHFVNFRVIGAIHPEGGAAFVQVPDARNKQASVLR